MLGKKSKAKKVEQINGDVDVRDRKFKFVIKNFLLYVILFILSLILWAITQEKIFEDAFFMCMIVFGILSGAMLMVLIIFVILRAMKNK